MDIDQANLLVALLNNDKKSLTPNIIKLIAALANDIKVQQVLEECLVDLN